MDMQLLVQSLGKLRFAASLPDNTLAGLAAAAQFRNFPAASRLFSEGGRNDDLMVIAVGRVALDMHVPGRGSSRILSLGPGDLIAWSALLGGGRMTATATALEDTEVIVVSATDVIQACEGNYAFGYQLMRQVAMTLGERLSATRLQLLDLFAESPPYIPPEPPDRQAAFGALRGG